MGSILTRQVSSDDDVCLPQFIGNLIVNRNVMLDLPRKNDQLNSMRTLERQTFHTKSNCETTKLKPVNIANILLNKTCSHITTQLQI